MACLAPFPFHGTIPDGRAYVFGAGGLHVVDVSVPSAPAVLGFVELPDDSLAVKVVGDHGYVACDDEGLHVVDLSDPSAPVDVATLQAPGDVMDVALCADRLVVETEDELYLVDISDPTNPVVLGDSYVPNGRGVAVSSN